MAMLTINRLAATLATAALALAGAACSSSSSNAPPGSGDGGSPLDASSGVTLSGTIDEFVVLAAPPPADAGPPVDAGSSPPTPIVGGMVCVYQHPEIPCQTTAADGTYELIVPANEVVSITAQAAGHVNTLYANYVNNALPGSHVVGTSNMPTTSLAQTFTTALGGTFPWGSTGALTFQANLVTPVDGGSTSTQLAGTTVSISPAVPATDGPFYTAASGLPDKMNTATTGAGWGGYVDVPVGTYQLTVMNQMATCGQFSSPTATTATATSFPVVADTLTEVSGPECR